MKRRHHDLLAWQQSIELVKVIYRLTANFPQSELYSLTSQMRRAAVSVPANIAEGLGRDSAKELLRFLVIARGSLTELDTYLVLTRELGYATNTEQADNQIDRVFGLLGGLINSRKKSSA